MLSLHALTLALLLLAGIVAASGTAANHVVVFDGLVGLFHAGVQRAEAVTHAQSEIAGSETVVANTGVVALHGVVLIVHVLAREGILSVYAHRQAAILEETALQAETVEPHCAAVTIEARETTAPLTHIGREHQLARQELCELSEEEGAPAAILQVQVVAMVVVAADIAV